MFDLKDKAEWFDIKNQIKRLDEYERILIKSFEKQNVPEQRRTQSFLNRIYTLKRKAEEIERLEY